MVIFISYLGKWTSFKCSQSKHRVFIVITPHILQLHRWMLPWQRDYVEIQICRQTRHIDSWLFFLVCRVCYHLHDSRDVTDDYWACANKKLCTSKPVVKHTPSDIFCSSTLVSFQLSLECPKIKPLRDLLSN